tara:strand:+ start:168 stop:749 length:582 start_codon:yes stop_codon:yes gene_type:complete
MKFICKNDTIVYIDLNKLLKYDNLHDADTFKKIFSKSNLDKYQDDDCNLILKKLNITNTDWLELLSFIKNGIPMYYSNDIFQKPDKKNLFMFSLERMNITFNKLGGNYEFDEFYQNFMNEAELTEDNTYNPLEPYNDYKQEFKWGIGILHDYSQMISSFSKYPNNEGWSVTKLFTKNKLSYAWFRCKKSTIIV